MSNSPYYPPSKKTYLDPNSSASLGDASVNATEKVDLSDSELNSAKEDVRNLQSQTDWCLFGYVGTTNKLKVVATGSGGIKDLMEELQHGKPAFGFLRVYLDKQTVPKFVYITWNPANVPPMLKGTMHGRAYDVGKFLNPFHLQMDAQSEEDLSEKKMLGLLQKAASK